MKFRIHHQHQHPMIANSYPGRLLVFTALLAVCFTMNACGEKNTLEKAGLKTPSKAVMSDYYPLAEKSYWSYQWENLRGDRWRGSLAVTGSRQDQGLRVFIVVDTTERYGQFEVYQSAYLWDAEGLKHLYRTSASGDCTAFKPPRLVLPATLDLNKPQANNYRYEIHSRAAGLKYAVDVRQEYKLIKSDSLTLRDKTYNDCLIVET
ncbi:MAG: hypothetical protein V2A61_07070, partial [Calditrichota bacterium]